MAAQIIPHTGKSLQKLKSKYPIVWDKLIVGEPDAVRWLLDNQLLYRSEAPEYVVVKQTRLVSVDKSGKHTYTPANH